MVIFFPSQQLKFSIVKTLAQLQQQQRTAQIKSMPTYNLLNYINTLLLKILSFLQMMIPFQKLRSNQMTVYLFWFRSLIMIPAVTLKDNALISNHRGIIILCTVRTRIICPPFRSSGWGLYDRLCCPTMSEEQWSWVQSPIYR